LHQHEFGNVESHDLKIAIEEATGRNLSWFFEQWVTGAGHPQFEVQHEYVPDRQMLNLNIKQTQPLVEGQGIFTLPAKITIATAQKRWQEEIWIKGESESFSYPCPEKPLMVSFDGQGDLVAELRHAKSIEELIYQAQNDALPGRMWALRELAVRFPVDARTAKTLAEAATGNSFWGLRAEATKLLGEVRTPAAEQALAPALKAEDYPVRKAAVLALAKFGTPSAEQKLREVVQREANADVVATAIVALAQANAKLDETFVKQQLGRSSWYEEIKVACLRALKISAAPHWVATLKPYTEQACNQSVVEAALSAWESCAPGDDELHQKLLALTSSPVYSLQQYAIQALGRLHVTAANATLQKIVAQQADENLTVAAKNALEQIAGAPSEAAN